MTQEITKQTAPALSGELLPPEPDQRGQNAVKHGALSQQVPPSERAAYAVHVQAVRESSGVQGYLEERLADRAALALWRLDRVARYEARVMDAEARRWRDDLHVLQPDYSALSGEAPRPLYARNLRDSLKALSDLTGEAHTAFLDGPQCAESYAQDADCEAESWALIVDGGDLSTLTGEQIESLGLDLLSALLDFWEVAPSRVARLLLGRKPTREEVEDLAKHNLTSEPHELPVLLAEAQRAAGGKWHEWLIEKRYEGVGRAGKIRAVAARLPMLIEQESPQGTMLDGKTLEKITRYEAHLERVLYRALHELEASKQAREGVPTLPPIRGVLDERGQDDG